MPPDRRSGRCGPGAGADEPPKLGIFSARFAIGRPDADSHFRDTTMDIPTLAARDVRRALEEDLGTGDLTAALIDPQAMARATVRTREAARLCGAPWAQACLHALDPAARMDWKAPEGAELPADFVFLELRANARALLSAERTMLNFLQLLSAVATQTAQYVEAVRGTRAQIVDTRKTLPGLRLAQKYAVRVGGGMNHRIGLFDAVLIKENHIAAAGGIAPALERARRVAAQAQFIEIEVETLEQLDEALRADARMILLDNMPLERLREAVALTGDRAVLEVSGGVDLDSVRAIAETGVDRISVGRLTKDVRAVDLSLRFAAE